MKKLLYSSIGKMYLAYRGRISPTELKRKTLKQIEDFQSKVEALSAEQLEARRNSSKWNGSEIVFHIFNATKNTLRLCEDLRRDRKAADLDRSAVGRTKEIPYQDLVDFCRKIRDQVSEFDFESSATRTCRHPLFGPRNFKQWLVVNLVHLERHYQQLIRITA
jgi:DinB superfamily